MKSLIISPLIKKIALHKRLNYQEKEVASLLKNYGSPYSLVNLHLVYETGGMGRTWLSSVYKDGTFYATTYCDERDDDIVNIYDPLVFSVYVGNTGDYDEGDPYAFTTLENLETVYNLLDNVKESFDHWKARCKVAGRLDILCPTVKSLKKIFYSDFVRQFTSCEPRMDMEDNIHLVRTKIVLPPPSTIWLENYITEAIANDKAIKRELSKDIFRMSINYPDGIKYKLGIACHIREHKLYRIKIKPHHPKYPYLLFYYTKKGYKVDDPLLFWIPTIDKVFCVDNYMVYPSIKEFMDKPCRVNILIFHPDMLSRIPPELIAEDNYYVC